MKFLFNYIAIGFVKTTACISLLLINAATPLANTVNTSEISGKYIGSYTLTMNTSDPAAMQMLQLPHTTLGDVEYIQLGYSTGNPIWQWDFDNQKITWGGGYLFAMGMVKTPFQPYKQDLIESKKGNVETFPRVESLDEVTIDFVDNGNGTFTASYAQKIHLSMQGYPAALAQTTFQVSRNSDGSLTIKTIDDESDNEKLDGVPGSKISGVFPYIVQPQYDAMKMMPETGKDSNNDGISDLAADLLTLNIDSFNQDNDDKNDIDEIGAFVSPIDSDQDGIADIFESYDYALKQSILDGLILNTGEKVKLTSDNEVTFSFANVGELNVEMNDRQTLDGDIPPEKNSEGKVIHYTALSFVTNSLMYEGSELNYSLSFDEKIPSGLAIHQKLIKTGFDMENQTQTQTVSYPEIHWQIDSKDQFTISLAIPFDEFDSRDRQIIIGLTDVQGGKTTDVDTTSTANSSSSSVGTIGFILTPLLLLLTRPITRRKVVQN